MPDPRTCSMSSIGNISPKRFPLNMFEYILPILCFQTLLSGANISASGVCLWTRYTAQVVKHMSFGIRNSRFKFHILPSKNGSQNLEALSEEQLAQWLPQSKHWILVRLYYTLGKRFHLKLGERGSYSIFHPTQWLSPFSTVGWEAKAMLFWNHPCSFKVFWRESTLSHLSHATWGWKSWMPFCKYQVPPKCWLRTTLKARAGREPAKSWLPSTLWTSSLLFISSRSTLVPANVKVKNCLSKDNTML